jgi:hypothetical protein
MKEILPGNAGELGRGRWRGLNKHAKEKHKRNANGSQNAPCVDARECFGPSERIRLVS